MKSSLRMTVQPNFFINLLDRRRAFGLPRLFFASRPLPPDPPDFADCRQPHGFIVLVHILGRNVG